MKLGIMQPYFFPYLGYFGLIKSTDKFVLFDTAQFIRHGWIERNRVLKQDNSWQYIAVPLKKHHQETAIKDVEINNNEKWKEKIIAQLSHYKKKSPFYKETIDVINNSININTDSITKLNHNILKNVCKYIDISYDCEIFSEMNLKIESACEPDEWALNICKAMGNVEEYINPIGGIDFFDRKKYENSNIKISFLKHNLPFYSQRRGKENFEAGLSIIDVMMFNPPEKIKEMLDDYELL